MSGDQNVISIEQKLFPFSEFSNQRALVERRARYHKVKSKKQFQQQFSAYISWISQAGILKPPLTTVSQTGILDTSPVLW